MEMMIFDICAVIGHVRDIHNDEDNDQRFVLVRLDADQDVG